MSRVTWFCIGVLATCAVLNLAMWYLDPPTLSGETLQVQEWQLCPPVPEVPYDENTPS